MSVLGPLFFIARTVNTACTAYCVGQLSWATYKKVREMQKEKMRAAELRATFVEEYRKNTGKEPDEATISAALKSYKAVEYPFQQYVEDTMGQCREALEKCAESKWLEPFMAEKDKPTEIKIEKNKTNSDKT